MTNLENIIDNQSIASTGSESTPVHNPSTGETIASTPHSTASDVDTAVAAAKQAFATWKDVPVLKRASIMFKYKELLEANFDEIVASITKENGKTLPESAGDLRRGIEVVDFACAIPQTLKGEVLSQVASQIDGMSTREPLGVCAGITPFNFPAMVPMWMFPLAIACGNTFVLKPSEKVPLTALRLVELAIEAGLPTGVLNLVHGTREVVERLCEHPDVSAISFVGSSSVAEIVYTKGCQHGKRVQAAGGAKNVMVVLPDADMDSTVRAIIGAAYGCAGQRCMAGSTVLAIGSAADELKARLSTAIDDIAVGPTDTCPDSGMGGVIDAAAKERLLKNIGEAEAEGAILVRDGRKNIPSGGFFIAPTLLDDVKRDMNVARKELFGPILCMGRLDTLEDALAWINESDFGNGAVIFTKSGSAARHFSRNVACGMVGVNVGVPAPMAIFSFSGWNGSFYGDLHVQGQEGILFYTRQRVVFSRWDNEYIRQQGW